jgi:hypothetical protein
MLAKGLILMKWVENNKGCKVKPAAFELLKLH